MCVCVCVFKREAVWGSKLTSAGMNASDQSEFTKICIFSPEWRERPDGSSRSKETLCRNTGALQQRNKESSKHETEARG